MDLTLEEIEYRGPKYDALVDLRQRILRVPFGHPLTESELATEGNQIHLAAYLDGQLAACLLLRRDGDEMRMRQVAVEAELRGAGIGKALVLKSEEIAISEGAKEMRLHARDTAIPFYEKLGYEGLGEPFVEIDIPHLLMRKRLD